VGVAVVLAVLFITDADASKRVRRPTMEDLATVWVGGSPSSLEFLRLDLGVQGTGLLTVQYLPTEPARAYRVTNTVLAEYRVNFRVAPAETAAEAIYLRGTAIPGQLMLEIGGTTNKWKRQVELEPISRLMARIQAVTKKAEEIGQTPQ